MLGGMKTYPLDLRERALAAVDRAVPRKEAVGIFGVSLATPKRWLKRREETGSAAPSRRPGMRSRVGADAEERRALRRQLEENPEAALEEHRPPSLGARAWRTRVGLNDEPGDPPLGVDLRAKTLGASERDGEARARWRERVRLLETRAGSSSWTSAARTSGSHRFAPGRPRESGPSGRRRGKPRQEHNDATGEHGTRRDGVVPGRGGRNDSGGVRGVCRAGLGPLALARAGSVLDDLSAHKGDRVRELVEERGAELLFLPSYSPDFSPIEEAFSKLKSSLRREKARTKGALLEAMGRASDAVTSEDARGWFGHCGYALRGQLP